MAAQRVGRNAGLDLDEILLTLFAENPDPNNSDEEFMDYSNESDRECHLDEAYPRGYQEEEEEILM